MKFFVKRIYAAEDLQFSGDAYEVELKDSTGRIVMVGDYYHNHIEDRINGFLDAVQYFGYEVQVDTTNVNEVVG